MDIFSKVKTIHFIGIGGISMSALAEVMMHSGFNVTGSDMNDSNIISRLKERGARIYLSHDACNVEGSDLVVYTAAVKSDNPEIIRAKELHIPIVDRAEFLGTMMKKYSYGIAISGTHGKTTTTSLVSIIFNNARLDPTILVGGELSTIGGNVRVGSSQYFITEACEYVESFLKFHPYVAAILNVEEDHLDYFRDLDHIMSAFEKFVKLIPKEGSLVVCADNKNALEVSKKADCNVISFGINTKADFMAKNITYNEMGYPSFDVVRNDELLGSFSLSIPGLHNLLNALAAVVIAVNAGIAVSVIRDSLLEYHGTNRRFDIKGIGNNITVIDDYAHHPTAIRATLDAAKQRPHNKIWCIFQPHTYSRTKTLLFDFADSFHGADKVIIPDIYSASREKNNGDIHSIDLVNEINKNSNNAVYKKDFSEIAEMIADESEPGDLVFTMGAGDVYKLAPEILSKLNKK